MNIQEILPLLLNKNLNQEDLLKNLSENNSNLSGIMSIMPMLQNLTNNQTVKKRKKEIKYVKVSEYYKHQS